jgi:hypothetical protein
LYGTFLGFDNVDTALQLKENVDSLLQLTPQKRKKSTFAE